MNDGKKNFLKHYIQKKKDKKTVKLSRSKFGTFAIFLFLLPLSLLMAVPLLYTILQSVKPIEEYFIYPPKFFVMNPTADNYRTIFSSVDTLGVPFLRYLFNTVFVTVIGTAASLLMDLITAYPLAKSKIKGVAFINIALVYAMLFSNETMSMVRYIIISKLGMIDTYWALILPSLAGTMCIFLVSQFMSNAVPDSVLEAARIDGAGEFRILFSIVAPSVKAGMLTAFIFTFNSFWSAGSSGYIFSEELKSLSEAMTSIASSGITRAGAGMAATLILMIPSVLVFLWNQRSIMNTMAHSGLK